MYKNIDLDVHFCKYTYRRPFHSKSLRIKFYLYTPFTKLDLIVNVNDRSKMNNR
ncbi:hypothetical protein Mgra_00003492 [Meloidogyne graminicola]|uniref:Uncharacterized protein n=1 Tax=Meloidogyne graminicola TaxID=189291 RepID=A0A8S9ZVC8_9BILA|nr:hypothetical protein Mgra_00003492 [Meloidogyne graminicola]